MVPAARPALSVLLRAHLFAASSAGVVPHAVFEETCRWCHQHAGVRNGAKGPGFLASCARPGGLQTLVPGPQVAAAGAEELPPGHHRPHEAPGVPLGPFAHPATFLAPVTVYPESWA